MGVIETPQKDQPETGLDKIPMTEWHDPAISMKERLAKQSARAAYVAKRSFYLMLLGFGGIMLTLLLAAGGHMWYKNYTGYNFYNEVMPVELTCRVKVGNVEMTGRRYFTYRYTDVLGIRLIDKKNITERTDLNVSGAGYTIVAFQKDYTPKVKVISKGEVGIEPLEPAESYVIFSDGKVGNATYKDLCRKLNPTHPFATTE